LAQGLKKDVGGRFRYAVGLQSWVNACSGKPEHCWNLARTSLEPCWNLAPCNPGNLQLWNLGTVQNLGTLPDNIAKLG